MKSYSVHCYKTRMLRAFFVVCSLLISSAVSANTISYRTFGWVKESEGAPLGSKYMVEQYHGTYPGYVEDGSGPASYGRFDTSIEAIFTIDLDDYYGSVSPWVRYSNGTYFQIEKTARYFSDSKLNRVDLTFESIDNLTGERNKELYSIAGQLELTSRQVKYTSGGVAGDYFDVDLSIADLAEGISATLHLSDSYVPRSAMFGYKEILYGIEGLYGGWIPVDSPEGSAWADYLSGPDRIHSQVPDSGLSLASVSLVFLALAGVRSRRKR